MKLFEVKTRLYHDEVSFGTRYQDTFILTNEIFANSQEEAEERAMNSIPLKLREKVIDCAVKLLTDETNEQLSIITRHI